MTRSLDDIMSGRDETAIAEDNAAEGVTNEANAGRERDEQGRFAARREPEQSEQSQETQEAPSEAPEAEAQAEAERQAGHVPQQALHAERQKTKAERERREELERQIATLQQQMQAIQHRPAQPAEPPPKAPEFWEDPDAFLRNREQNFERQLIEQREAISKTLAISTHGAEVVQEAEQAIAAAINTPQGVQAYQRIMSSQLPYDELVKWHRQSKALQTYGEDPDAYINAEIERRMAERAQQTAPQPVARQPNASMPSSFAAARSSGPRGGQQYGGPRPLSEITQGSST